MKSLVKISILILTLFGFSSCEFICSKCNQNTETVIAEVDTSAVAKIEADPIKPEELSVEEFKAFQLVLDSLAAAFAGNSPIGTHVGFTNGSNPGGANISIKRTGSRIEVFAIGITSKGELWKSDSIVLREDGSNCIEISLGQTLVEGKQVKSFEITELRGEPQLAKKLNIEVKTYFDAKICPAGIGTGNMPAIVGVNDARDASKFTSNDVRYFPLDWSDSRKKVRLHNTKIGLTNRLVLSHATIDPVNPGTAQCIWLYGVSNWGLNFEVKRPAGCP